MQKLMKGNITQKIVLILILAILCNFIIPNYSHADNVFDVVLFDPIRLLTVLLGDVIISAVNVCFTGQWIYAVDSAAVRN